MTKEKGAGQGILVNTFQVANHSKESVILKELCYRSINRFDAERSGDHCLNSTISVLRKKGVFISQEREKVPTRFGKEISVCRYWIAPENRAPALELLGGKL